MVVSCDWVSRVKGPIQQLCVCNFLSVELQGIVKWGGTKLVDLCVCLTSNCSLLEKLLHKLSVLSYAWLMQMQWEQELTRQPKRELSYVCVMLPRRGDSLPRFCTGRQIFQCRHAHRHNRGAAAWVSKVVLCASRWFSGHCLSLSLTPHDRKWSPLPLSAFTHLYSSLKVSG